MKNISLNLQEMWMRYFSYVKLKLVSGEEYSAIKMSYWQNKLFIKTVAITMPLSLTVMIPCIIIFWSQGTFWIPIIDILTLLSISLFILCTKYSIKVKMGLAVSITTCFAVFLMASLNSFGIGCIYLLALSVVIPLLFSGRIAYYSICFNFLIFFTFSILIFERLFAWPSANAYKTEIWVTYSLNFLFVNAMIVVQIRHILTSLQKTIDQEEKLSKVLHQELDAKTELNMLLADSEGHYKSLFFNNPSPMWIFDTKTLRFVQVNNAAVKKYGFSKEDFMQMTVQQIRTNSIQQLFDLLEGTINKGIAASTEELHRKKNGKQFFVKIKCSTIPFRGIEGILVIADDITTQMSHSIAIEKQNEKLKSIAYIQSHTIRAPLAKMKGLWALLSADPECANDPQFYTYMKTSMEELDVVIKRIIKDSDVVPLRNADETHNEEKHN